LQVIKRITTRRLDQSRVEGEKDCVWWASHNPAAGRDTNPSNPTCFLLLLLILEPNFRSIISTPTTTQPFPGDISLQPRAIPGFSRVGGSGLEPSFRLGEFLASEARDWSLIPRRRLGTDPFVNIKKETLNLLISGSQ
jgi:hypothetical protein